VCVLPGLEGLMHRVNHAIIRKLLSEVGEKMQVKLIYCNAMYAFRNDLPEYAPILIEVDDSSTIGDFITTGDLSEYYPLSGTYTFNTISLPYIINSNDEVEWDVLYNDAKVLDFIRTHNIHSHTIIVKDGYIQAGGPGFKELAAIWQQIYPIIDGFVTLVGFGIIVGGAGAWVHSLFKKRSTPHAQFCLLFSRTSWHSSELAQKLGIGNDEAKQLLKLFGYKYDNKSAQYVQHVYVK